MVELKREVVKYRRKVIREWPLQDGLRWLSGGGSSLVRNILWANSLPTGKLQNWPKNE